MYKSCDWIRLRCIPDPNNDRIWTSETYPDPLIEDFDEQRLSRYHHYEPMLNDGFYKGLYALFTEEAFRLYPGLILVPELCTEVFQPTQLILPEQLGKIMIISDKKLRPEDYRLKVRFAGVTHA